MQSVVSMRGVSKSFGGHPALAGFDLEVGAGEVVLLLRPNGAGKSTALRLMLGFVERDGGEVAVLGRSVDSDVLSRVGYVPEQRGLLEGPTIGQMLAWFAEVRGVVDPKGAAAKWLARIGLTDWANQPMTHLSKGNQQKVQLAVAMIHTPDLLVLDEPFSGLDAVSQEELLVLIREEAARGAAVIVVTHEIDRAETIASRVVTIVGGRKQNDSTLAELRAATAGGWWRLAFDGPDGWRQAPEVAQSRQGFGDWEVRLAPGATINALVRRAIEEGASLRHVMPWQPPLRTMLLGAWGWRPPTDGDA